MSRYSLSTAASSRDRNLVGLLQLPAELLYEICALVNQNSPKDLARLARASCHLLEDISSLVLVKYNTARAVQWALRRLIDIHAGRIDPESKAWALNLIHRCAHLGSHDELCEDYWYSHKCGLLHVAAHEGDVELARKLLQRGLCVNSTVRDRRVPVVPFFTGLRPLAHALAQGHGEVVRLLLEHGATLELDGLEEFPIGVHAVHVLAAKADSDFLREMVQELKLDVNLVSARGRTPLHWACSTDLGAENIKTLLSLGADPMATDDCGQTPMYHLPRSRFTEQEFTDFMFKTEKSVESGLKALIAAGANMNIVDWEGFSPLGKAASVGDVHFVKYLMELGADVNLGTATTIEEDPRGFRDRRPLFSLTTFHNMNFAWRSGNAEFDLLAEGCARDLLDRGAQADSRVAFMMLQSTMGTTPDTLDSLISRFGFDNAQVKAGFEHLSRSGRSNKMLHPKFNYMLDRLLPEDPRVLDEWEMAPVVFGHAAIRLPGLLRLLGPNFDVKTQYLFKDRDLRPLEILFVNRYYDYEANPHALDFLLDRGADVNATDPVDRPILELFLMRSLACAGDWCPAGMYSDDFQERMRKHGFHFRTIIGKLVAHGLNLNMPCSIDSKGSFLHQIVWSGHADAFADCARCMVENGADPSLKDAGGWTVLEAYRNGFCNSRGLKHNRLFRGTDNIERSQANWKLRPFGKAMLDARPGI